MAVPFKKPTDDPDSLFFTPAEIGTNLVRYAELVKTDIESPIPRSLTWGVPSLDKHILPLRMGKILFVVARPGNGKSSTAAYLARRKAEELAARGDENRIVIYITLDQPVEEIEAIVQAEEGFSVTDIAWGRADVERMKERAIKRVSLPLWLMGKSVISEKVQPRLTYENIYNAIRSIKTKYKLQVALVVLDYLQAFRIEGKRSRTDEVTEATFHARELSLDEKIPLVVCVQASRETDTRDLNLPGLSDCQWASSIEQEGDAIVSIARPVLYKPEGTPFKVRTSKGETVLTVTQQLFMLKLLKQRMSPAGQMFYLYFDPALVKLADLEIERE